MTGIVRIGDVGNTELPSFVKVLSRDEILSWNVFLSGNDSLSRDVVLARVERSRDGSLRRERRTRGIWRESKIEL